MDKKLVVDLLQDLLIKLNQGKLLKEVLKECNDKEYADKTTDMYRRTLEMAIKLLS